MAFSVLCNRRAVLNLRQLSKCMATARTSTSDAESTECLSDDSTEHDGSNNSNGASKTTDIPTDTSTSDFLPSIEELIIEKLQTKSFGGVPFSQMSKRAQKKRIAIALASSAMRSKKVARPKEAEEIPTERCFQSGETLSRREHRQAKRDELKGAIERGIKVAIDCSMQDRMIGKEICMLAKQIQHAYSANKKATKPFHIYLTGFKEGSPLHSEFNRTSHLSEWLIEKTEANYHEIFDPSSIIYLSPDAPTILEEIDEHHTYVVGGLVDESLEVGCTYNAASTLNIQTARFPIDKYMIKTTAQHCALAINHVFGIMIEICNGVTWPEALMDNIPVRKGYIIKPEYQV